jgi:3-dehydroquinate synthase
MSRSSRIPVRVPGRSYDVLVERGSLARLGEEVREVSPARLCALVTDENVDALLGLAAEASLHAAGFEPVTVSIPAGEASKSWATAGRLVEEFSEAGLGRDSLVIALGGGVVGDVAGFAAAAYLRGVPVVQVPTTLLAQADSAIGGKTGVDLPRGKNLAGAFWQPLLVLSDPDVLASLLEREWFSGLAEVVKSAALDGEAAFAALEADAPALRAREAEATGRAVLMAAALKARVVSGDEREAADRECLNYGHTLAHAIERELGYGTVTHGAAVADGLRFAARLAVEVASADPAWADRQEALLDALGLTPIDDVRDPAALLAAMKSDKKARRGVVRFVLSSAPGSWVVAPVDDAVVAAALTRWCETTTGGDS